MNETVKVHYPSINGLRAISIMMVVFHHFDLKDHPWIDRKVYHWYNPIFSFLEDGQLGVNVFFLLSGFLITVLLLREEASTKAISLKKFYIRRVLRIFPAYYFMLLVYCILQLIGVIYLSHTSWLTSLTFTKYFCVEEDWLTAHAWSLSIEEHFYLIWPLIFICGSRIRKAFVVFLIVFVPVVRVYLYHDPVEWITELSIFTRIDAIATGCLFALYKDEIIEMIRSHWVKLFYISAVSLFILHYITPHVDKGIFRFIFVPLGCTHGTIANFLIGVIMMYSVFGPQTIWFRFLNLRAMHYIGMLSYSIYLWQQIFTWNTSHWLNQFPQNLAGMLGMALFSYYVIEKYFLKLKSRFELSLKNSK